MEIILLFASSLNNYNNNNDNNNINNNNDNNNNSNTREDLMVGTFLTRERIKEIPFYLVLTLGP